MGTGSRPSYRLSRPRDARFDGRVFTQCSPTGLSARPSAGAHALAAKSGSTEPPRPPSPRAHAPCSAQSRRAVARIRASGTIAGDWFARRGG